MGIPADVGAVSNLGYRIPRGTAANMLRKHGIEPAPEQERKTTWREFLKRHSDLIVAADFFTIEVWTCKGYDAWWCCSLGTYRLGRCRSAGSLVLRTACG
jgi:hypothetical protein